MFGKLVIVVVLAVVAYLTPGTRGFAGWILFLGVIIAFVIEGVRIVPQQFAYVVERLGRFHQVLEPGLNLIIPFLDRIAYTHSLKEVPLANGELSVMLAAYRLGIPCTVHAALGAEIIHQHPATNGAAIGDTSHRDFRRLAASLPALQDGGVVLNLGSAVIMPEVFLKALTIARNLNGGKPTGFTTCDLDMQRHYRPRVNVVQRPTQGSGKGYEITGHHEIMVPMLVWGVVEAIEGGR